MISAIGTQASLVKRKATRRSQRVASGRKAPRRKTESLEESVQQLEVERVDRGTENGVSFSKRRDALLSDFFLGHALVRPGHRRSARPRDDDSLDRREDSLHDRQHVCLRHLERVGRCLVLGLHGKRSSR